MVAQAFTNNAREVVRIISSLLLATVCASALRAAAGLSLLAGLAACGSQSASAPHQLRIVTTTTLLASLAQSVAGSAAVVDSLLPVAASPETFQPAPQDAVRLARADVLVSNGAGLETWLASTVKAVSNERRIEVVCSDGLPIVDGNPHLWLDPRFASAYVGRMRDAFTRADPAHAADYQRNAAALQRQLAQLETQIARAVASVPPARREMIVYHNAWLYYNKRFGITTLAVVEEHPGAEPDAAHLAHVVDLARAHAVHTMFAEPEYNSKLIESIAKSGGIAHVQTLYDDSVGTSPETRDYLAMLRLDTARIVAGLR